ncbi:MAG TPA: circularly permuted type 2 ATP-grasp protein [Xanthobacteraceae bacterium]|nr:circularly permuted type 2 ATP-grasp protein [Xanthobacteraceae bacterium]
MSLACDNASDHAGEELARLLAGYRPLPGIFDEMMDPRGAPRGHWQPFLSMLAALGTEEIERRFSAADRHLRDSGVFYRVYEDPAGLERAWPLSHVPLVISAAEWEELKAGLIQRAGLLEAVASDAYGQGKLVREGRLPAALIAGNPDFLRPLVGVAPSSGAHLRFYAVDVGRAADGRWWVLGDRTQAPSGAGYALENRIALSRAMPDIYRALRVNRVAPFFQAFQAELTRLGRQDDSRVCVLTPGPMNETYFEHAYLARYLGFLLVEGQDLTVRDDGVFVRTVSGLKRAEVLLRRLDGDFSDPLELNARSRLGVPGLVQAVRDRKVVIANSLGAGLLEARGLLAFLPALAPHVLAADLAIPNVATWWLGHKEARRAMADELDTMVLASAFTEGAAEAPLREGVVGGALDPARRKRIAQAIDDRGIDYVAQEAVTLSTMPAWRHGRLEPRPFSLRLFLAKVGTGWQVMPGGFVRVADGSDARAVSLQRGASTADAWVLSEGPVADTTLLPTPERIVIKRAVGVLPSRAADNLLWVGRYIERAEATLRLVRALINRTTEADETAAPLVARISALLGAWSAGPIDIPHARAALIARAALSRGVDEGSLPHLAAAARGAAAVIRDRFSPDAWRALVRLAATVEAPLPEGPAESAISERVDQALRIVASFSGLAQENMSQLGGWRFLELGRRIERGIATCRFVRQFADDAALEVLLELADSQITYRQRYVMVAARAPVVDLVVLDPNNPRSVAYQLDKIEQHLAALHRRGVEGRLTAPQQIAAAAATALRTVEPDAIDDTLISATEHALMRLSEAIAAAYLIHNERAEPRWEALD